MTTNPWKINKHFNNRNCRFDEIPLLIGMESFVGCNLSCKMCGFVPERIDAVLGAAKKGKVDRELFVKTIDGLAQEKRTIVLSGRGEPLLNPELPDLVEMCTKHGHFPGFFSNATLMTEVKARELLGAGLKWVFFSVDGATAATFEALRIGAKFDVVIENILRFKEIDKREFGNQCSVMLNCVLSDGNKHERDDMIRFWRKSGVVLRFSPLSDIYGEDENFGLPEELGSGLDRIKTRLASGGRYPCSVLWDRLNLTNEGEYTCCYRGSSVFENVPSLRESSLLKLWRDGLEPLREQHVRGKVTWEPCASCPWWADRSEKLGMAYAPVRSLVINGGLFRMDLMMRVWNAVTGYRPISTT